MKKRYTVLGLSLVLALALAVPAMGGPTNPLASASKSVQSIANQALKKAKAAQKTANAAQSTANSASSSASAANSAADKAQNTATAAQKSATAAQTTANGAKSTADTALATANAAKTAAATAQASANSAISIAETKMSGEVHVESTEPGSLSFANCPTGKVPTGGGFVVTGANNNSATVTESTQYVNSWLVIGEQINGVAGTTWEVTATVNCATSP